MNFFAKGALIILTIFVVLFIIGILMGEMCHEIGNCKECWMIYDEIAHYNSLVDLISCACLEAKKNDFKDSQINYEIERIYENLMNNKATSEQICNGEVPLIKYETK
ncbi:MAG: hypothetical protein QXJ96_00405 [Candidatus Aenigmatarchaeota archaeon]|nr:hypothetical protein [Candidatus Aenigmarchaeota archaeon]